MLGILVGVSETTSSRLLTLLSLLQGRRDWPGTELAERLEVSARTIRRDVERLRTLGYPVESMTGPAGGYQLRAGAAMPPLLLDDDEAIAIAVALRTAAGSSVMGVEETAVRALVKLEQVLPAHLRRRVQALGRATQTLQVYGGGPTVDPQCLTALAAAVRDHERVRFNYTARDKADSKREAEPHSLVNAGRRWYLVAWDCGRTDWRTFRVDRIEQVQPAGARFVPRTLPTPDAASYVQQSLKSYRARYEARVVIHAPVETLSGRYWLGNATAVDEHTSEVRTSDDNLDWLAMRIAMISEPYEVDGPPELLERLRAIAEGIARATP
ncbi:YafY family transcriptional regulator [Solirubrobacter sp. CPCC 204708]|nr:YafY family transcriptional regulator [Solirubrobacter deserti]